MSGSMWRRVWNSIGFGKITAVDDSGTVQNAQLTLGYAETRDATPVVQLFGLSGNAPVGSDATLLFLGGDRANGVVIATNHQGTRPTGQASGETSLYNSIGLRIYLSGAGIVIEGKNLPVTFNDVSTFTVNAPSIVLNGNVTTKAGNGGAAGSIGAAGEVYRGYGGAGQVGLGTHTHDQPNDSAGDGEKTTDAPNAGT